MTRHFPPSDCRSAGAAPHTTNNKPGNKGLFSYPVTLICTALHAVSFCFLLCGRHYRFLFHLSGLKKKLHLLLFVTIEMFT